MRQEAIIKSPGQTRDWKDGIKGSYHGMGMIEFQLLEQLGGDKTQVNVCEVCPSEVSMRGNSVQGI